MAKTVKDYYNRQVIISDRPFKLTGDRLALHRHAVWYGDNDSIENNDG